MKDRTFVLTEPCSTYRSDITDEDVEAAPVEVPSAEPSIVFSGNSVIFNALSNKFNELRSSNKTENPYLLKVLVTIRF